MTEFDRDTDSEPQPEVASMAAEAAAGGRVLAAARARAAESFVHLDVISCYSLYASPSTPADYAQALSDQLGRTNDRRNGGDSLGRDAGRRAGRSTAGHAASETSPDDAAAPLIRAIALADYGLHSAVKMARACAEAGIGHIPGLRVRLVPARAYRTWRERAGELVLLAADDEGWLNLVALNNLGHISGWHDGAPRLDWHDLARHTGGLICLSGGSGAGVLAPSLERSGDPLGQGDALRVAERLAGLFPGRLYVELAYHGHASEKLVNRGLLQVAERLELPTVATNAVRMARSRLSMAHRVFRTMGQRRRAAGLGDGPGGFGWSRDGGARGLGDMPSAVLDSAREQAYLKSGAAMARLFAERPGDVLASQEIARRCAFRIPLAEHAPPEQRYGPQRFFSVGSASPDGAKTALAAIASAGLEYRFLQDKRIEPPETIRTALRDELGLVCEAGLAELLLAAHQVASFCVERQIPLAARGSATSSLVAWSLGLVEVLPTDHGLSSETFIFEGRPDRPDLDLEVASAYESAVKGFLQAVGRREGRPQPLFDEDGLPFVRALRLGTCVSFGSRLAVRQAGQAFGLNEIKTNILARQVPLRSAPGAIEDVFSQPYAQSGVDVSPHSEPWTTVLEVAGKLESLPQRYGVHPSGFAFSFDYAELVPDGAPDADPPPTPGALRWLPAHWVGTDSYQSGRGATLQRHVAVIAAEEGDAFDAAAAGGGLAHPGGQPPTNLRPAAPAPAERHEGADDAEGDESDSSGAGGSDGDILAAAPGAVTESSNSELDGRPALVCQWDRDDLDALGLTKLDVSLSAALTMAVGPEPLPRLPDGEPDPVALLERSRRDDDAWSLLLAGETRCIQQVETWGVRKLLMEARKACLDNDDTGSARALSTVEELAQLLALYKPGARGSDEKRREQYLAVRFGGKTPEYPHPAMASVLDRTHGQIVYSEQLTALVKLAGVSHAKAERFRRLINGKDFAAREKLEVELRATAESNGWTKDQVSALLGLVLTHNGYLHNQGHALAYAYRVFAQARRKANPKTVAAFFCEVFNSGGSLQYGMGTAAEEARKRNVLLLPPCVNRSRDRYAVEEDSAEQRAALEKGLRMNGAIRFPMVAVSGLPAEAAQHIAAVRDAFGPFEGLVDFCVRVDRRIVTRTHLQILIKLGAFAFTGISRSRLMVVEPHCASGADLLRLGPEHATRLKELETALAETAHQYLDIPEYDPAQIGAFDLAHMGCYLAAPLEVATYEARLKEEYGAAPIAELREYAHHDRAAVGGVIIVYREIKTRRSGEMMAWMTVADGTGAVKCGIYPSAFARVGERLGLREGIFIVALGKVAQDETEGTLLWVDEVKVLSNTEARASAVQISVERRRTDLSPASWMRQ